MDIGTHDDPYFGQIDYEYLMLMQDAAILELEEEEYNEDNS